MSVSQTPPGISASTSSTAANTAGSQTGAADLVATDRRNGIPAGAALMAGALGLVLAIVLNSQQLLTEARQKSFGWERDVSVAVWEPVEGAASAAGLHLPRLWADEALGRQVTDPGATTEPLDASGQPGEGQAPAGAGTGDASVTDSQTTPQPPAGTPSSDTDLDAAAGTSPGGPTTGTGSASSAVSGQGQQQSPDGATDAAAGTPAVTTPWFPTPSDPLALHIMGDSMVQFFGHVMVGLADDTGVIEATSEHQLSSGLSRPDFYDWPRRIVEYLAAEDPHAVVLMFGGNDAQAIAADGQIKRLFSDAWMEEYSSRVGHVMDLVTTDPDRVVLWVGQPIMEDEVYDSRMQQVNEIFSAEAAKRDRVRYVDTRELFRGADGGFSRYVADADGQLTDVRLSDGVHLSTVGGRWLSEMLLDELGGLIDLESGAPS